jgi:hypothetical protein
MDRFVVSRLELPRRCDCATDSVRVDLSDGAQAGDWKELRGDMDGKPTPGRKSCSHVIEISQSRLRLWSKAAGFFATLISTKGKEAKNGAVESRNFHTRVL